jgi:hypothetical protein
MAWASSLRFKLDGRPVLSAFRTVDLPLQYVLNGVGTRIGAVSRRPLEETEGGIPVRNVCERLFFLAQKNTQ